MSRGTIVKLLRVFPERKFSKARLGKLLEKEKASWPTWPNEKEQWKPPAFLPGPKRKDFRKTEVVVATREEADVLLTWWFGSSFTHLAEIYNLSYCKPDRSNVAIPERDIREMQMACRYLLSRKYSREMDQVLAGSEMDWISALANPSNGEVYWPYVYRDKSDLLASAMEESGEDVDFFLRKLLAILDTWDAAKPDLWDSSAGKLVLEVEVYG